IRTEFAPDYTTISRFSLISNFRLDIKTCSAFTKSILQRYHAPRAMIKRSAKSVIAESYAMARGAPNGSLLDHQSLSRTITGLRRWSIINRELPGEASAALSGLFA